MCWVSKYGDLKETNWEAPPWKMKLADYIFVWRKLLKIILFRLMITCHHSFLCVNINEFQIYYKCLSFSDTCLCMLFVQVYTHTHTHTHTHAFLYSFELFVTADRSEINNKNSYCTIKTT